MGAQGNSLTSGANTTEQLVRVQEGCNTLEGCSAVVNAAIDALHRQRSSTARNRQQVVRVSFADAVKHLQSHYGPSDKQYLADDPEFSSWDDSIPEEEDYVVDEHARKSRDALTVAPATRATAASCSPSAPALPAELMAAAGVQAATQPSRSLCPPTRPQIHVSPPYSGMSGASADDMPLFSRAHVPNTHDSAAPAQYASPATPSSRALVPPPVPGPASPAGLSSSCSSLSLPSPSKRRYDSFLDSSSEEHPFAMGISGNHPASPSYPPVQPITSVLGPRHHAQPSMAASATAFVERQRSAATETPLHRRPGKIALNASPACTASPDSPSPSKRLPGDGAPGHDDASNLPLAAQPGGSPTLRHFGRASVQPADGASWHSGRLLPLQTSQELNHLDTQLWPVPEAAPPHGHAAPPSPLGMRHSTAAASGLFSGVENAEPRGKGGRGGSASMRHGASPDIASPSSPFGRITSPLEESAALLRSMRRGHSMTQPGQ